MEKDKKRRSYVDGASVDDEADVFEITDFTTASEWERFIARIEEILHEWKLVNHEPRTPALKDQYAHGTWADKSEELIFADYKFVLSYVYLKTHEDTASETSSTTKKESSEDIDDEHKSPTVFFDLMNFENDFPSRAHYLCRWYGLQEFVTISPANEKQPIESESRSKLLLSSVAIAFGNSHCSIPAFVQVQQKWRKLFTGTCITRGASIEFEMSHLRQFPSQYCHLAGLLDVFKSKLGCVYISMPPVSVAVRFTYVLQDWIHSAWPQLPPDFSSFCDGEVGYGDVGFLPFGACRDPISELHLSCTWPCLSEDIIVENSRYSDLDPLQAPMWTACLQMTEDPQCLLGEYLQDFLKLCNRIESTEEVLRKVLLDPASADGETADISNAFQRLTEPVPSLTSISSIGNVVSSASARIKLKPDEAPIPDSILDKILYFLFPEAKPSSRSISPPLPKLEKDKRQGSVSSSSLSTPDTEKPPTSQSEISLRDLAVIQEIHAELNKQLKSASPDSLTHRLSLALCNVNHNHGGLLGVAHLWQEFILELRFRWENKILLTGLEKGAPNMGSCLLHQKLQMLNCCIECKIKRESVGYGYGPDSINIHDQSFSSGKSKAKDETDGTASASDSHDCRDESVKKRSSLLSSDDEDEFFECDEDSGNDEEDDKSITSQGGDGEEEGEGGKTADDDSGALSQTKKKSHSFDKADEVDGKRKKRNSKQERNSMLLSFYDSLSHPAEGRRVPMKNMFLLKNSEQMYIPLTQEPSPMTEDMLEEQAEVLAKLGSSAEGSEIRARMQSACLVSDMESFKAANPGCILEDFVRWYSPRDYIVEDNIEEECEECPLDEAGGDQEGKEKKFTTKKAAKGRLSQRMEIPGNMWVEAWQSAKPVPARRQKRLFDDTREAEKVLHYLSSMRPAEVVLHLMPCVVHAAIAKMVEESVRCNLPNMKNLTDQIISRTTKLTRNFPLDKRRYFDLLRLIEMAETLTARSKSLRSKFSHDLAAQNQEGKEEEIETFVTNLLSQAEVQVRGGACGPAGAIIHKMFIAAQKSNHMILDDEDEDYSGHNASSLTASMSNSFSKKDKLGQVRKNSSVGGGHLSSPSSTEINTSSSCPDFPPASAREYILRAMVPRPASYSKVLPQRMYCLLTDGDNRLAGAFTSDSTFQ